MLDKPKETSLRDVPWRAALAASVPALVAIVLVALAVWRWTDSALAALPDVRTGAQREIIGASRRSRPSSCSRSLFAAAIVARRATDPVTLLARTAERAAAGDLTVAFDARRRWRAGASTAPRARRDDRCAAAPRTRDARSLGRHRDDVRTDHGRHGADVCHRLGIRAHGRRAQSGGIAHVVGDHAHRRRLGQAPARVRTPRRRRARWVARNDSLAELARNSRARLEDSSSAVSALASVAESSASSAEAVSHAAHEIESFVTLVRRIARRTKLLSLNASMEAARAGEHGQGFGVVASELRSLATTASEAAERTEMAVALVLERVEQARESSRETVTTLGFVQHAQREAYGSFSGIEQALEQSIVWLRTIGDAAAESGTLLADNNARLAELARGTESFASAMQQVAAGSQQQSAGAEQIAAASAALAGASQALQARVSAFRVGEG